MDLKTHVAATLEIIGSLLGSEMYIDFVENVNKYILWYNISIKKSVILKKGELKY